MKSVRVLFVCLGNICRSPTTEGVAAAHDRDLLASIKESVAGGAGRYAKSFEMLLRGQTEPFRLRAGGEDHGVSGVGRSAVSNGRERTGG